MTTSSWNLFERFQGFLHFQRIFTRAHIFIGTIHGLKKPLSANSLLGRWLIWKLKIGCWKFFRSKKIGSWFIIGIKFYLLKANIATVFFLLKSLFSFTIDYLHLCSLFIASCECIHGILSMIFNRCVIHKPNQIKFTLHWIMNNADCREKSPAFVHHELIQCDSSCNFKSHQYILEFSLFALFLSLGLIPNIGRFCLFQLKSDGRKKNMLTEINKQNHYSTRQ